MTDIEGLRGEMVWLFADYQELSFIVESDRSVGESYGPDRERAESISDALRYLLVQADKLAEALRWYAEPVLAYAITQKNEPRSAVHADGGKRARQALADWEM